MIFVLYCDKCGAGMAMMNNFGMANVCPTCQTHGLSTCKGNNAEDDALLISNGIIPDGKWRAGVKQIVATASRQEQEKAKIDRRIRP